MNETTNSGKLTARQLLVNYITQMGGKTVVERAHGIGASEPWSVNQQISWAIQLVKNAVKVSDGTEPEEPSFDKDDEVAQSPERTLIALPSSKIYAQSLKTNPALLKLAVKAFAEVAGVDPEKVTTGVSMKQSFLAAAANGSPLLTKLLNSLNPDILRAPSLLVASDKETADQLVDFAKHAILQGGFNSDRLEYKRR